MKQITYYPNPHFKKGKDCNTNIAPVKDVPKSPCKFLGKETGNKIQCQTCTGEVMLKLFQCEVYGECTLGQFTKEKAGCKDCPSYVAKN